ncbi:hypothetical protein MHU86_23166 [Fragilaria crotonensis]|nr:hypothetical protein MHU86_23166 [Fragilaria crotonensis]
MDVALYNNLRSALTAQILTAVNPSFRSALEDPDFGFGDVTPLAMLEHFRNEYGTMTPEELERNRAALSEPWNLDDPIEDLWAKIINIQRVAALGGLPIPDLTVITLTLAMIEKTGLLVTTTDKFRLRPTTEWTLDLFKAEFKLGILKSEFGASPLATQAFMAPIIPVPSPRLPPMRRPPVHQHPL